jgi:hypothetical protein
MKSQFASHPSSLLLGDCVIFASGGGEAVGFQSFRMLVF